VRAFSNHSLREQRMFLCSFHVLSPHLTVTSEKRPVSSNLFPSKIGSVSELPERETHRLFYFSSEDKNLLFIAPVKFAPAMPGGRVDDVMLTGALLRERISDLVLAGAALRCQWVLDHWQLIFLWAVVTTCEPRLFSFLRQTLCPDWVPSLSLLG